jgi:superfamily II DNA or RNA helicase
MSLTAYHAKLFAHELTKRSASDSVDKLASALSDAQVTLNPHQIEAALFAFRSPLSKGAILADEVGLGKTIEAGILLAQRWAERRRRLLIICPANLRKQWSQELADKFFLPTAILEAKTFNDAVRAGNLNPLEQSKIIICSFQFARSKEPYLRQTAWDLVVIDEAHRLRNVYKPGNKIGKAIKHALTDRHKVLLTATPLQNSLEELYGLVSLVDEYTFGDLKSFKAQFGKSRDARPMSQADVDALVRDPMGTIMSREFKQKTKAAVAWESKEYAELKERLRPICQRTLRRQVLQYVSYTNRHALVQEFVPSEQEQRLYDLVSDYLQQPTLYALPSSQRQLMTLILRKLLASSSHAISGTLAGLAAKLEAAEQDAISTELPAGLEDNFELLPELEEEWAEDDDDASGEADPRKRPAQLNPEQREELRQEIVKLREFHTLATRIQHNSKGDKLLTALKEGFRKAEEVNSKRAEAIQQKALIFTESRRTQDYLFALLQNTEFAGKVVLFNGSNTDELSQRIYRDWAHRNKGTDRVSGSLTADKRAALVDFFRDEASIMIATEAAAEGINLQFCNLVVNYDLPWNPQRIEQRIGRCHRYGQKFDVVVVNFLNRANAADVRVYQLLAEKFQLFEGVFGASDEVLGAIESGVDFEKRIVDIYQQCRTPEQISLQFDQLQQELQSEIGEAKANAHKQLLNNFDQEVIDKVRAGTADALDRFQRLFWRLTEFSFEPFADFAPAGHRFTLRQNPFPGQQAFSAMTGLYEMRKEAEGAHTWRIGHPLAQAMLQHARTQAMPVAEVVFQTRENVNLLGAIGELKGMTGWLTCAKMTLSSVYVQDQILFSGVVEEKRTDWHTYAARELAPDVCRLLFDQPKSWVTDLNRDADGYTWRSGRRDAGQSELMLLSKGDAAMLEAGLATTRNFWLGQANQSAAAWLDAESIKLDRWAEDRKLALEEELKDLDRLITETKREALAAQLLPQKVALQQALREYESSRTARRRELFEAQDKVAAQRDTMIETMQQQLQQQVELEPLFTIKWSVV